MGTMKTCDFCKTATSEATSAGNEGFLQSIISGNKKDQGKFLIKVKNNEMIFTYDLCKNCMEELGRYINAKKK